jgi:hypothetical protein
MARNVSGRSRSGPYRTFRHPIPILEVDVVEQHSDPQPAIGCPDQTLGDDVPGRFRLPDRVLQI